MILGKNQPFASPEEALAHFGIKGMRWGIRKSKNGSKSELKGLISEPITLTTKNGDKLTLAPVKVNTLMRFQAKVSSKYRENFETAAMLDIKDNKGNNIGSGQMWLRGKNREELYLNWIDIDQSARGRGYASTVLIAAEAKGREVGAKKMTLEVPGISPDARHIYEKQGFLVTKEPNTTKDLWGGLTTMEKKLN